MRLRAAYPEPIHAAVIRAASRHALPNLATQFAASLGIALAGIRTDADWYGAWFLLGLVVLAVRLVLCFRLRADLDDPAQTLETLRRRDAAPIVFLILTAGLWTALACIRLPVEALTQKFTILVILSALTGGAVGVLAPRLWAGRAYITLMLVPASLILVMDGGADPVLGVLGLIFWVMMIIAHTTSHRLLVSTITLGLENAELAAALQTRTDEVEEANRELEARVQARTEQLSEMATKAQSASRAKSEFLATISHEIRTPLNGVIGMAQVMDHHPLSRAQRERLSLIQSSAGSLLDIINDVLDISKIESGRMETYVEPFDAREFASGIERIYAPLAREKGLGFKLTFTADGPSARLGDAVKLRQIVSNLVANAIKFTVQGEVGLDIVLAGDDLRCSIWDTGVGIPEHMCGEVFEPFVQVDGSMTRLAGGSGLGLAICRELAVLLGGEVGLTSAVGVGSRFDLRLPMPPTAAVVQAPERQAAPHGAGQLRILVVDDNATNRLVLQSMLRQLDIASDSATDGAEAVAAWAAEPWDAILMDVHMPGTDGLEAARQIRALERQRGRPRTPIVAVTASVMSHETDAYLAAGMDGVVGKPIQVAELLDVLQAGLAQEAA
jgi:signal transduction histidine kinase/ActR/RegA family two-component response regulator